MDQQEIQYRPEQNLFSAEQLKKICQNMIRKDLEIFRIQDLLIGIFRDTEFYSRHDDEFLSVDHTLQLAFGKPIKELDETLVGVFQDCTMTLAFDHRTPKGNVLAAIEKNASFLADQIFSASEEENAELAILNFVTAIESNFPHLDIWEKLRYVSHLKPQITKESGNEQHAMVNLVSV